MAFLGKGTLGSVEQGGLVGRQILAEVVAEPLQGQNDVASSAIGPDLWRTLASLPASVMIAPPHEWPTSKTGASCIPITRSTAATSSARELSGQ